MKTTNVLPPHFSENSSSPGGVSYAITAESVAGVDLHRLPVFTDPRGSLSFGQVPDHLPFDVCRYFLVYGVPQGELRGAHAHRECHQFLVCVAGSCQVAVDDGMNRCTHELNSPSLGLHLSPRIWGVQYDFSPGAVLMVLASHPYDDADYIRDYATLLT